MKTIITYSFSKSVFDLDENLSIEFENPPYIPANKQRIDIDYGSFFSEKDTTTIEKALEDNKNILPYKKTDEVWNKDGYHFLYEFMHIEAKIF